MQLKLPLRFGKWVFFVDTDEGEQRVPAVGFAKSERALTIFVDAVFHNLASQGKTEYLTSAQEEAKRLHYDYWTYLQKLVQHQICIRNGGTSNGLCNSSGLGDNLHAIAEKVDRVIAKSPTIIKRVAQAAIKAVVLKGKLEGGENIPKLSGCGTCGGSRSYKAKGNNLGRAGRLNK